MGDHEYWQNIRDNCFNDAVGKAFYTYLMQIDTSECNSQELPETVSKADLCAELISPLEKFLKFQFFLLRDIPIKHKVKDLHSLFVDSPYNKYEKISIQKFATYMRDLGFTYEKTSGYNTFKITVDELKEVRNGYML